jgi:hypothetical protein
LCSASLFISALDLDSGVHRDHRLPALEEVLRRRAARFLPIKVREDLQKEAAELLAFARGAGVVE